MIFKCPKVSNMLSNMLDIEIFDLERVLFNMIFPVLKLSLCVFDN